MESRRAPMGLYLVFLKERALLPSFEDLLPRSVVYVGKSEDLRKRPAEHFRSCTTGRSTLRRTLGALLKAHGMPGLHAFPRGHGKTPEDYECYRFGQAGEDALTTWMMTNLDVCVREHDGDAHGLDETETCLIRALRPVLCIGKWPANPHRSRLEALRGVCRDEAREAPPLRPGGGAGDGAHPEDGE